MHSPTLPFTVYPSKMKLLLLFLVCVIFVAAGAVMIWQGEPWGWLCVAIFGLGLPVFFIQLFPGSSYLTVTDDGIECCSMFRSFRVKWSEIEDIGVSAVRQQGPLADSLVGLNFSPAFEKTAKLRSFSKSLNGFEGCLPDTYRFRPAELEELLSAIHRKNRESEKQGADTGQ